MKADLVVVVIILAHPLALAAPLVPGTAGPDVVGPGETRMHVGQDLAVLGTIIVQDGGRLVLEDSTLRFGPFADLILAPGAAMDAARSTLRAMSDSASPNATRLDRFLVDAQPGSALHWSEIRVEGGEGVRLATTDATLVNVTFTDDLVALHVDGVDAEFDGLRFVDNAVGLRANDNALTTTNSTFQGNRVAIDLADAQAELERNVFLAGGTGIAAKDAMVVSRLNMFLEHLEPDTTAMSLSRSDLVVEGDRFEDWACGICAVDSAVDVDAAQFRFTRPPPTTSASLLSVTGVSGQATVTNSTFDGPSAGVIMVGRGIRIDAGLPAHLSNLSFARLGTAVELAGPATHVADDVRVDRAQTGLVVLGSATVTRSAVSNASTGYLVAPGGDAQLANLTAEGSATGLRVQGVATISDVTASRNGFGLAVAGGTARVERSNFSLNEFGVDLPPFVAGTLFMNSSRIMSNSEVGLHVAPVSGMVATGSYNWFEGNGGRQGCPSNSIPVPLPNTYWGDPSGPDASTHPGSGDKVFDSVAFVPFLTAPP